MNKKYHNTLIEEYRELDKLSKSLWEHGLTSTELNSRKRDIETKIKLDYFNHLQNDYFNNLLKD